MPTRRSTIALRLLFGAVALSLPLTLVVKERVGEPYPGLFQPTFESVPGIGPRIDRNLPELRVTDDAGRQHAIALDDLVDARDVDPIIVRRQVRSSLSDASRMRTPEARRWLRDRFTQLGIAHPVELRVRWRSTVLVPGRRDRVRPDLIVRAYRVDLRGTA